MRKRKGKRERVHVHRALTHACPSGEQNCPVARRDHQVATLTRLSLVAKVTGTISQKHPGEALGGPADGGRAAAR